MASPSLVDDDEDDGFDWEAAVREIDSACQNASASTSNREELARPAHAEPIVGACPGPAKPKGKPRQSTLDRFVDSFEKRKNIRGGHTPTVRENAPVDYDNRYNIGGGGDGDGAPAVEIDLEAAKTWIYPVNIPLRDYQFSIAKTALFSNTLVALPTGLGKTLIAAVVMYNYFRWFPEGKIVFTAPSRPLVMQQIEACHNIVGIPQEWTIDMTGQMSPPKRSSFWKCKRVFFVTPQVLEKDIQSGICLVKQLVCLVIDEAHRALGNYSYCIAVHELMAVPVQLRILALTATPGSKQRTIQNVIDNLCISTLEYRNEGDKDVNSYVHDRKLELIEVSLGKDAIGINNLLLEAIQPFVTRLCAIGVLRNRDSATLSPCELLNSRDKFRQAPPLSLPHAKHGEVEGYFGVLITLYHIRKLLSSHGIRPAYEMLEEKLKQGSFARLMSRNETIWKAKLLMQQSLSHGAPNPKLVKMIEILVDHFKKKDPKDSRAIIFSNFRGSVKDIMSSLSNIGDLVKATEFIGQSSGKTLKGQSQKVQQAVLQKFRAGGFNVIVATSIGEEGLDIVEVDLVICFDANVSPLRMIQRMGRTGRKHDGRVVVLACEGSELKGYLKKQTSSKAVRKHMHNGGVKSFDFHSSPRMIPHICKPQVQFIELSIEQFVPRRKKAKDDATHQSSYLKKISNEESALLARYFHPSKEGTWRPSLICFPHFQAFPSRVYRVQHSFKTTAMLIDAMQHLQVLSCSKAKKACLIEDETASNQLIEGAAVACHDSNKEDFIGFQDATSDHSNARDEEKVSDSEPLSKEEKKGLSVPDLLIQKPSHCFLFGEDFVTVDAFGGVFIASVPVLPIKRHQVSKVIATENDRDLLNNTKNDGFSHKVSGLHNGIGAQLDDAAVISELRCTDSEGTQKGHASEKFLLQTPVSKGKPADLDVSVSETPPGAKYIMQASLAGECRGSLKDIELSPRLTHFIEEGIVPESPAQISHYSSKLENTVCLSFTPGHNNCGSKTRCHFVKEDVKNVAVGGTPFSGIMHDHLGKESLILCHVSPNITKLSGLASKELSNINKSETGRLINTKYVIQRKENVLGSAVNEEIQTPLAHPKVNSSSEDWQINSDEAAKSVTQAPKYKRLCKYKDIVEKLPCNNVKENFNCSVNNTNGHATRTKLDQVELKRGKKEKAKKYANTFIDEEAEVSEDAAVSDDEQDNGYEDEYDDSFIDDRVNPSETGTQATNGGDMMAFYRRSLLTQSPIEVPTYMVMSHESASPKTAESGSCSLKHVTCSHQSSQYDLNFARQSTGMNSVFHQLDSGGVIVPAVTSSSQMECLSKLESRKRKLNFHHVSSITATNLQQQHAFQLEHAGEASWHHQSENTDMSTGVLCDDDFYRGLDLDELEAQATKLLRNKSELSIDIDKAHRTFQNTSLEIKADAGVNLLSSPSFDLGV